MVPMGLVVRKVDAGGFEPGLLDASLAPVIPARVV
jgi:hypothetical protein